MASNAACWAGLSMWRARTAAAGIAIGSAFSDATPTRANIRPAMLAFFTALSTSFKLCEPGCSSRNAISSRADLLSFVTVGCHARQFDAQAIPLARAAGRARSGSAPRR